MVPLKASRILIVDGVMDDPLMRVRADRLCAAIDHDEVVSVDDSALATIVETEIETSRHHGMRADDPHIVILNRFRFDDDDVESERRVEAFPNLNQLKFNGYGGFDWRDSGSAKWRADTGLVCQPAWQLHTVVGCPFRCAYCHLGWSVNLMLNMEDFVAHLDEWIRRCPKQTLFQYDNWTDTVCFEPEYDGARLLIDYFARQKGKALELYVGKSDNVDFLLDYGHRGHTVCCWSLSGYTQSRQFEYRAATMEERIESMKKCQDAGYPVRVRLSPIIPVRNWQDENRDLIEQLFRAVDPDVITFETLRFLNYERMCGAFDLSLLDEDFVAAMQAPQTGPVSPGCQVPDDYRKLVYEFIISELERVSPGTPYALCREKRDVWEFFEEDFARHDQHPDDYFCNCGPFSAPATVGCATA